MRTLREDFQKWKKDSEVRLKEVEAMAMMLRNPYILGEERFSVVQTSVEVTEPSLR